MKRLSILSALVLLVAVVSLAIMLPAPTVDAADPVQCSWGALKCCFGSPPCVNACCPRPKENVEQASIWIPTIVRMLTVLV